MLSPTLNILGVIIAFAIACSAFCFARVSPGDHFFLPIYLLILYYTVAAVVTDRRRYDVRPVTRSGVKAIGKYFFWLALIGGLYGFYGLHPFYIQFAPHTRHMLGNYLQLYALAGPLYFFYTERYRYSTLDAINDPYLRIISLFRTAARRDWTALRHRLFTRGYKSLILSWLVRLHFLPVMVEQVHQSTVRITGIANSSDFQFNVGGTAALLVVVLFCIDATNASIGYFWESSLTGTRFRETDPNPFHWIIVLVCYYPFIRFAGSFIPFPSGVEGSPLLFNQPWFEVFVNTGTIVSLAGMVYVTTSLGFSYSNLSYKKIQTKGLYRFVRHPGTVCKLSFFFFSIFRYRSSGNVATIALFVIWMAIYFSRALCEERFLRQFREYRTYMNAVRYRFIPGML
jgi:protein-S-isoprenylcysteine O-methyltransferase Ste14